MPKPPETPQATESYMVDLAVKLAEKKLKDGTAPAPVIVHYLKLGSSMAELERAKVECETEMMRAKADSIRSSKDMSEKIEEAMQAMRLYSGDQSDEF